MFMLAVNMEPDGGLLCTWDGSRLEVESVTARELCDTDVLEGLSAGDLCYLRAAPDWPEAGEVLGRVRQKGATVYGFLRGEGREIGFPLIEPVYCAARKLGLRQGAADVLVVEAGAVTSLAGTIDAALVDRAGIVAGSFQGARTVDLEGLISKMLKSRASNGNGHDRKLTLVCFGQQGALWAKNISCMFAEVQSSCVPIHAECFGVVGLLGADIVIDRRMEWEGGVERVQEIRAAFRVLMDDTLNVAIRAGRDADDIECERLALTRGDGATPKWMRIEDWAASGERETVSALRLYGVVEMPKPALPW